MFETLNNIDWAKLEHSHGTAEDVPKMMLALAQGSSTEQKKALSYFWDFMVHQGSRYQTSQYVVPYLIEILESRECRLERELLDLLLGLAVGLDESFLPDGYDLTEEEARFKRKDRQGLFGYGEARSSYYAVLKRAEVFPRLMAADRDREVRLSAAFGTAHFAQHLAEHCDEVVSLLVQEGDEMQRQSIILCLGMLLRYSKSPGKFDLLMPQDDATPSLKVASSIALLTAQGTRAYEKAVRTLLMALQENWRLIPARIGWNWWNEGDLLGYAGKALLLAAPEYREQIARAYIAALKQMKFATFAIPYALLDLLFPKRDDGAVWKLDEFDSLQRLSLKALVESPHWRDWMIWGRFLPRGLEGAAYQKALRDFVLAVTERDSGDTTIGPMGNVSSWDLEKNW